MNLRKLETERLLVTGRRGRRSIRLLGDFKETGDWKGISDGKTRKKTYSATE